MQLDYVLKLISETSLIGAVHHLHVPSFPLILLLEKHKSVFISDNKLHTSIISCLVLEYSTRY